MTAGDPSLRPALQLLNLLREQAPSEIRAFWRYATAAVALYVPQDASARQEYVSDLRIVLRAVFCTKCDMPDDKALTSQVEEALALVEAYSAMPRH